MLGFAGWKRKTNDGVFCPFRAPDIGYPIMNEDVSWDVPDGPMVLPWMMV